LKPPLRGVSLRRGETRPPLGRGGGGVLVAKGRTATGKDLIEGRRYKKRAKRAGGGEFSAKRGSEPWLKQERPSSAFGTDFDADSRLAGKRGCYGGDEKEARTKNRLIKVSGSNNQGGEGGEQKVLAERRSHLDQRKKLTQIEKKHGVDALHPQRGDLCDESVMYRA